MEWVKKGEERKKKIRVHKANTLIHFGHFISILRKMLDSPEGERGIYRNNFNGTQSS